MVENPFSLQTLLIGKLSFLYCLKSHLEKMRYGPKEMIVNRPNLNMPWPEKLLNADEQIN